ncbi:MAG: GIY-YIG nuclease family protein, partial [Candidatus Marinimicrobia bacterium]|nr:GIY-YIG nuclease family protein [Candidatus Neomarinimicrobiota bacterium]
MKYFVYVLYSESSDQYYVGHTEDIDRRLNQHNSG